jgi:divalent metal cation (Fe/Co/Zn/Cd) transporter
LPALVADGKHPLTDIASSVGVAMGGIPAVTTKWAFSIRP